VRNGHPSRYGIFHADGAYCLDIKFPCSRIGNRACSIIRYVATLITRSNCIFPAERAQIGHGAEGNDTPEARPSGRTTGAVEFYFLTSMAFSKDLLGASSTN
jgi:hypothetical protein